MEKWVNDLHHCRLSGWPFPPDIEALWLADGVLQLLPVKPWSKATVVSAGIHGNETAPIEILLQVMHGLSEGQQPLQHALLLIFGNLPAMRASRRYWHYDLNRLFGGRHRAVAPGNESRRAQELESVVEAFFATADSRARFHASIWICIPPFAARATGSLRCCRFTTAITVLIFTSCCRRAEWTPSCAIPNREAPLPTSPARCLARRALRWSWVKSCRSGERPRAVRRHRGGDPRADCRCAAAREGESAGGLFSGAGEHHQERPRFYAQPDPKIENFTALPAGYEIARQPEKRGWFRLTRRTSYFRMREWRPVNVPGCY